MDCKALAPPVFCGGESPNANVCMWIGPATWKSSLKSLPGTQAAPILYPVGQGPSGAGHSGRGLEGCLGDAFLWLWVLSREATQGLGV